MNREELQEELTRVHAEFMAMIAGLQDDEFVKKPGEKWTPGQHLEHILRSVIPVEKALMLPQFLLKMMIGKANRSSRSYDEVVAKYRQKLEEGGKSPHSFLPKAVRLRQRASHIAGLARSVKKLNSRFGKYSEHELDTVILPHPLLGKLTLREMLYFTIYHVQHHEQLVYRDLEKWAM